MNTSQISPKPAWVPATDVKALPVGGRVLFRHENKRIALFRLSHDEVFAVDNQCPHEGYPLMQGTMKGNVLTCCWHNYKFDIKNGRCLMGDEDVRGYSTRFKDGKIEVDVSDPSPETLIPHYTKSLEEGLFHRRMGQVARDVVRLLKVGMTPADVAFLGARYDAERAEYGTTHAMPTAFDVLAIAKRHPGVDATLPLMQVMDMVGDANQRLPKRETPAPSDPGDDAVAAGQKLFELVEDEDIAGAEALVRGAIDRGWMRDQIEPWFFRLCTAHFLGFGHALIYVVKAFDLLEAVGWSRAMELLPALLVRIVNQTREEVLPEWAWFRERMAKIEPRFAELSRKAGAAEPDKNAMLSAVVDGTREESWDAIEQALEAGVELDAIVNVLSLAAAQRLLRFDVAVDQSSELQEGWLDVTHVLTFTNAVRAALVRYDSPDRLKLLFYATRFTNHARVLDMPVDQRIDVIPDREQPAALGDIVTAIVQGRDGDAVRSTVAYLAAGGDIAALRHAAEDLALADPLTRPIVVVHLIKTCAAAFAEMQAMGGTVDVADPVLALVRFAASPVRERAIARLTHEAIRFVEQGKVPKTRT